MGAEWTLPRIKPLQGILRTVVANGALSLSIGLACVPLWTCLNFDREFSSIGGSEFQSISGDLYLISSRCEAYRHFEYDLIVT